LGISISLTLVEYQSMFCQRLIIASISLVAAICAPAADAEIRIATAGPMTSPVAWFGEQYLRAAEMAIEDLNARGGVLGQRVELIVGDDFCDAELAVAVARKFASDGVVFVAGHFCSHSSIAAAKIYEEAKILQIAPGSASAKLTDEGRPNVFRVCGRDDQQGRKVADHIASEWAGKEIAILDDGTTWGAGVANAVRRRLHELGVRVAMDDTFTPGKSDYSALVSKMQTADIDVSFVGGLHPETALIFRQAHDRGYNLRLIVPSSNATGDFPMIAGPGIEGTFMMAATDARGNPQAAEVVARFRAQGYDPVGYTLYVYAAVQVWAQAAEEAGSLNLDAMVKAMHSRQFDTVLGRIGFDEKGDVNGFEPWQWYVWQADGTYVPVEQSLLRNSVVPNQAK
jgi:branched-chain amino acid transport system substrate-binding protein